MQLSPIFGHIHGCSILDLAVHFFLFAQANSGWAQLGGSLGATGEDEGLKRPVSAA